MKVALVCSHGGHLMELRALEPAWAEAECFWITYRSPITVGLPNSYLLANIGRNPLRMAVATMQIAAILLRHRPDVIVSTGAELAIPTFYLARLLRMRSVFIEVWTRVKRPTVTGRLVYGVTDYFFVQWPEMEAQYGNRARYVGRLL